MACFLKEKFSPILETQHRILLNDILTSGGCAVHVRRGDLAVENPYYGCPTSLEYFRDAICCVKGLGLCPDMKFFFFSDDPDYCERNLLPLVGSNGMVCRLNGSDKGYIDLYLISKCRWIISSQGSLGVFGALFSGGSQP